MFEPRRLGTNPLAEAQARIAELEAALVDARNSIHSWISENEEKIAELEADNTKLTKKLEAGWVRVCQTGLVEAHDRIAELERQLGEARRAIGDAYLSGYEKAHDDTVEGWHSPEQSCEDYIAAMRQERK